MSTSTDKFRDPPNESIIYNPEDTADYFWLSCFLNETDIQAKDETATEQSSGHVLPTSPSSEMATEQNADHRIEEHNDGTIHSDEGTQNNEGGGYDSADSSKATEEPQRVSIRTDNTDTIVTDNRVSLPSVPFRVPASSALPAKLEYARAFRPLMERVDSRTDFILDELKTAEISAEQGELTPEFRPAKERWFDLTIIFDTSSTMLMWYQTAIELKQLVEQSGIFRNVYVYRLEIAKNDRGLDRVNLRAGLTGGGRLCHTNEVVDVSGRRLLMVFSDCSSSVWYSGSIYDLMRDWLRLAPTVIVQPLPVSLWQGTVLSLCDYVYVHSLSPACRNTNLEITFPDSWLEDEQAQVVPIPAIPLSPLFINQWARMMVGRSSERLPAYYLPTVDNPFVKPSQAENEEPSERWNRFRGASKTARQLVGYLAAIPLQLPIMKLVQRVMLPNSRQSHLAEILRSGLFKPQEFEIYKHPDQIQFEFQPGVREFLQNKLFTVDKLQILSEVSNYIESHQGQWNSFRSWLEKPGQGSELPSLTMTGHLGESFAEISIEILKGIGGEYRLMASLLEEKIAEQSFLPDENINGTSSHNGFNQFDDILANPDAQQTESENVIHPVNVQGGNSPSVSSLIDRNELDQAGWGIIFSVNDPNVFAIKEALAPLLKMRAQQAGRHYHIFEERDAYRPGESASDFLRRFNIGANPVDPSEGVPYYLLLIGNPELIPFEFQYQLALQFAVGRLDFDTPDEYANYAKAVVKAETGQQQLDFTVTFFSPKHKDDSAITTVNQYLTQPLVEALRGKPETARWNLVNYRQQDTTRTQLEALLGGDQKPALLFTATHGIEFPLDDPRQESRQGALLCNEWPGPAEWQGELPESFYFAGDQLAATTDPSGMIAFFFGDYTAGTPKYDNFDRTALMFGNAPSAPQAIANRPFIANLPKKLLGHPNGGTLSVIGHVDRPWAYSIRLNQTPQVAAFETVMRQLMVGKRVGVALESFSKRRAVLAARLNDEIIVHNHRIRHLESFEFPRRWTEVLDARNYIILGDPAVHVSTRQEEIIRPVQSQRKLRSDHTIYVSTDKEEMIRSILSQAESSPNIHIGIDIDILDQTGWGIIFAYNDPTKDAIKDALTPLLRMRAQQAGSYYRIFDGVDAYRPGESASDFLQRFNIGADLVDPKKGVPYYLLLIGNPELIPFEFQYQLALQFAVGRLDFDTPDEYANYAKAVVKTETGQQQLEPTAAFFSPEHKDDSATTNMSQYLAQPLVEALRGKPETARWNLVNYRQQDTTRTQLEALLGGDQKSALLFTATHGIEFPLDDPRQESRQGALLCNEWPGPAEWQGELPESFYFAGDQLAATTDPSGMIAFLFGDYTAGTPQYFNFDRSYNMMPYSADNSAISPKAIAARPFIANLPKRLLGHPNGGALAVIGHVDRAWSYSFRLNERPQITVFENTMQSLMQGKRVGVALESFNKRYAVLAARLNDEIIRYNQGVLKLEPYEFATRWTEVLDARNYIILGDPAVRVAVPGVS